VILIIASVVLGYGIYKQRSERPGGGNGQLVLVQSVTPDRTEPRVEQSSFINPSLDELDLSEEEKKALSFPNMDASDQEKQSHSELVKSIATSSPYLDISGCVVAEPIVFKIKQGETFTVRNGDDVAHAMVFDKEHRFDVAPRNTKNIVADFGHGPGIYGYACDLIPRIMGLILVTP